MRALPERLRRKVPNSRRRPSRESPCPCAGVDRGENPHIFGAGFIAVPNLWSDRTPLGWLGTGHLVWEGSVKRQPPTAMVERGWAAIRCKGGPSAPSNSHYGRRCPAVSVIAGSI